MGEAQCGLFFKTNSWCRWVTSGPGERSGTCAALRAAEGEGLPWAWAAAQGTLSGLPVDGLAGALRVSATLRTDLRHLVRGLLSPGTATNYSGSVAGSRSAGFRATHQLFTLHSGGCTMPFTKCFLSRNTAKASEVANSVGHRTMMHWIYHGSGWRPTRITDVLQTTAKVQSKKQFLIYSLYQYFFCIVITW